MASLKDLMVLGPARFLDKIYGNLEGNASTADKLKTVMRRLRIKFFLAQKQLWATKIKIYI